MNQLTKFAVAGSLAGLIHLSILHFLVQLQWLQPLYANAIAFIISFSASYLGQSLWTFNHRQHNHCSTVLRFLITQLLCNFALNQGLYTLLLSYTQLNYLLASFLVLATVPAATYSISKYWAFR